MHGPCLWVVTPTEARPINLLIILNHNISLDKGVHSLLAYSARIHYTVSPRTATTAVWYCETPMLSRIQQGCATVIGMNPVGKGKITP